MRLTIALLVFLFVSAYARAQDSSAASWAEKVRVKADVRFRHDYTRKPRANATADSHRERFRARLAAVGQINDKTKVKFRVSTAERGNNISTNQTMTDSGDKKSLFLDLAYVDWTFINATRLVVGKQENALRVLPQSLLMYDGDFTPEGASLIRDGAWFGSLNGFSLVERSPEQNSGTSEPDSWLMAAILGTKKDNPDGLGYTFALGYHDFTALKKNPALKFGNRSDDFAGNSQDHLHYVHDYQVGEALTELRWRKSDKLISVFEDFITNFDARDEHFGVLIGSTYALLNEQGQIDLSFTYHYTALDKDATVSALNNSNFANGYDGACGHTLIVTKALAQNTTGQLTWMKAKVDNYGDSYTNERMFADVNFEF